jgi:uncharacterized protein YvpB
MLGGILIFTGCSENEKITETYVIYNSEPTELKNTDTLKNLVTTEEEINIEIEEPPQQVYNSNMLDVKCVLQNPELPTGCEVTSLTTALNYYGYDIDKVTLATEFLHTDTMENATPWRAFIGTPTTSHGFGCYAPVIVECAESYIQTQSRKLLIYDLTGSDLEDLFYQIDDGNPVIIWATINMIEPYVTSSWVVNDETFNWLANEHCLVLTGYDKDKNLVYVSDPLKGNTSYDMTLFKTRYEQLYKQAVVLRLEE